jgi:hypothetical protein
LPNLVPSIDRDGWDIEAVVEKIWVELGGAVEYTVIDQVVQESMPRYEDAWVKTFVPIFVQREALDQLKRN